MAFELPTLPFPKDDYGTPYIASPDANNKYTVSASQWFKNASNLWVPVSASDPLPVIDASVQSLLLTIQAYVDTLEAALGEVQDQPTAYTVLARLKMLEGYLDTVESALGTQTDQEASGDGSLIAILKRLRTLVAQPVGRLQQKVTLANAVAISDTDPHSYDLITHGGLTEDEVRQYQEAKIWLKSTHDQAAAVSIYLPNLCESNTTADNAGLIYSESDVLGSNSSLMLMASAVATGAPTTQQKQVPALHGVFSNIIVQVQFLTAPTSGSLTIVVELGG